VSIDKVVRGQARKMIVEALVLVSVTIIRESAGHTSREPQSGAVLAIRISQHYFD